MGLIRYNKVFCFSVFIALFFGALTFRILLIPNSELLHEYDYHIALAEKMAIEEKVLAPHFLFHFLTIGHHKALSFLGIPNYQVASAVNYPEVKFDWGIAALIVAIETYLATALIIFYYLRTRFKESGLINSENLAYLVAFSLCIITPISVLSVLDEKHYLGYINFTIYIIPTQILLKLAAVWMFALTPLFFKRTEERRAGSLMLVASLAVMGGLAKPNFLIVMIPALALLVLLQIRNRQYVNWCSIVVTNLAAACVLGWQFYFAFINTSNNYTSSIILTPPFEILKSYSDYVELKILLSIVFPLYVYFAYRKEDKNIDYTYAWILYFVGLFYSAFVAEAIPNKISGNFIWSGQVATFLLFVASAAAFFSRDIVLRLKNRNWRDIVGVGVFALHVGFGGIYYARSYANNFM